MSETAEAVETSPAAPTVPGTPASQPSGFEDAFGAIDALGREDGTPAPPETPPPGDGRVRGPDGKFLPKEKTPDPKPPETPNGEEIDPSKLKTSELAKHYHKLKAEQKEWVKQREEYEKKLKTPPEWPEKKTYEQKLAEREKKEAEYNKRLAEYEQELQFTNFTKSQAYKDQYQKPLEQAYKAAQSKTAMLQIVERKDEEGNVLQAARDATAADFDAIMRITDERTAIKKSVELFGDGAAVVLQHRERVFEKNALAEQAIEEYRTKGSEREKTIREQETKQREHISAQIEKFQKAQLEQYPKLLKPDESNPKDKELFEKSGHWFARVLAGGKPLADGEKQWSDEQMAIASAAVRNKTIAFDPVSRRNSILTKRVKELETELAQFKSSRPGNGNGNGRQVAAEEDDPLIKIEKMGRNV